MRVNPLESVIGWAIPVVLLALGAVFLWAAPEVEDAIPDPVVVDRAGLEARSVRVAMHDPAHIEVATFDVNCLECHALFESDTMMPEGLQRHDDIVLDHGQNGWCFSCHDIERRDRLALTGGETVGYDDVPQLCAKCHGPTWRDWERGIHGKTIGSWKHGDDRMERLSCTDCHDPHAPAFDVGLPLPGPNTIRMGVQNGHHDNGEHRPLSQWLRHISEESHAAEGDH